MRTCWVEIWQGKPVRIYKSKRLAIVDSVANNIEIKELPYAEAVSVIRKQVVTRADGECEWCSKPIGKNMGHLHEVIFRSRGGEISLANSVFICPDCHLNVAHKDRRWQSAKLT